MSNNYTSKDMISVENALDQILSITKVLEAEQMGMLKAAGRVLAQDITSDIDIAPFDNSAMDGFAIKAQDTTAASPECPARLKIIGVNSAGAVFDGEVHKGEALRIMTGAPLPAGADTVVPMEQVEVVGEEPKTPIGREMLITKPPKMGQHVRLCGEEAHAGEVVLGRGAVLSPAGVGLLASTGNTTVEVHRRPRVAILSSGDELVDPSQKPGPGQIRNANCYSLAAAATAAGAEVCTTAIVGDDIDEIRTAVKQAVAEHDLVMISGGAAEGDYDYTNRIMSELGEVFFTKVNMRPGKAQTLGLIDGTIVFGLAGNPSAAMVGFEVLLRPAIRRMQGYTKIKRSVTRARLTADAQKPDQRRFYLRARMEYSSVSDEYLVTPEKNQSSALLKAFQQANCLVVLPEGLQGNIKDEIVACMRLDIDEGVVV